MLTDRPGRKFINKAIESYALSTYHQAEYARCMFLKHEILRALGDEPGAKDALVESVKFRRQVILGDMQPSETLTLDDFDRMLSVWFH